MTRSADLVVLAWSTACLPAIVGGIWGGSRDG